MFFFFFCIVWWELIPCIIYPNVESLVTLQDFTVDFECPHSIVGLVSWARSSLSWLSVALKAWSRYCYSCASKTANGQLVKNLVLVQNCSRPLSHIGWCGGTPWRHLLVQCCPSEFPWNSHCVQWESSIGVGRLGVRTPEIESVLKTA